MSDPIKRLTALAAHLDANDRPFAAQEAREIAKDAAPLLAVATAAMALWRAREAAREVFTRRVWRLRGQFHTGSVCERYDVTLDARDAAQAAFDAACSAAQPQPRPAAAKEDADDRG